MFFCQLIKSYTRRGQDFESQRNRHQQHRENYWKILQWDLDSFLVLSILFNFSIKYRLHVFVQRNTGYFLSIAMVSYQLNILQRHVHGRAQIHIWNVPGGILHQPWQTMVSVSHSMRIHKTQQNLSKTSMAEVMDWHLVSMSCGKSTQVSGRHIRP